ncbi:toxin-antitoxin system YwqK family antitoxin [Rasiella sp. SM2506]|uniref:toxin-antitoxin system YwqK family antitoxin n=1 Tax=Rasiella sp. SM2506 TaxID=3423914 RepID=UPI003D7B5AC1
MKSLLILLVTIVLCISCSDISLNNKENDLAILEEKILVINTTEILKEDLVLNQLEGRWYYKDQLYSGYSLRYYPNDTLAERIGYHLGKREGIAKKWSENGVLRIESHYKNNRLHSDYKSWWENGVLAAQSNYVDGIKQGIEREWYASGQLAKKRQLVDGNERGLQQAWLENGKLYVNYEAKNGRIFGMRKANSCYKLEDETIIRN